MCSVLVTNLLFVLMLFLIFLHYLDKTLIRYTFQDGDNSPTTIFGNSHRCNCCRRSGK